MEPVYVHQEKFPMNSIIELRNLSKNSKKWLRSRMKIGNGMKILQNLGEDRLEFVEKFNIIKIWRIIPIEQRILRKLRAMFCAIGPKMKKIFKFFKQNLWKIEIVHNLFYYIFLGFLHPLRRYIPLEDNTSFLQQFFRFRGGGTFRRFPSPSRR